MAEAFNNHFVDSVAAIAQCFFPEFTKVKLSESHPVNTMEQSFNLNVVTELDVIRIINSFKPSKAKDIFKYGCSNA